MAMARCLAGEGSLVAVGVQPDRITDPDTLLAVLERSWGLVSMFAGSMKHQGPGTLVVPLKTLKETEYQKRSIQ